MRAPSITRPISQPCPLVLQVTGAIGARRLGLLSGPAYFRALCHAGLLQGMLFCYTLGFVTEVLPVAVVHPRRQQSLH